MIDITYYFIYYHNKVIIYELQGTKKWKIIIWNSWGGDMCANVFILINDMINMQSIFEKNSAIITLL